MTAKDFAEIFKPYLVVGQIVEKAGWSTSSWYAAVSRERELTSEEMSRLRQALRDHAKRIQQLAKRVR